MNMNRLYSSTTRSAKYSDQPFLPRGGSRRLVGSLPWWFGFHWRFFSPGTLLALATLLAHGISIESERQRYLHREGSG